MNKTITRRTFVRAAGRAGAALGACSTLVGSAQPAEQEGPVTLALVGCAHSHAPGYVDKIKTTKGITVKYVWDPEASRASKWAAELGARAVADDAEIWADPQVRAVVICSQTNLHHRLVLAAAHGGKSMFVEKPMGMTGAECREMADAIEKAKLRFMTGYGMRTQPVCRFLKEQVAQGTFGKITRVRAAVCHDGSLNHIFDGDIRWMADPQIAGCGGFGDLGTHGLDVLMWLMGDVERVAADIKVVTGRYGPCDESGEALIRFKNGVTGTLAAGWVDVANPKSLEISGTEAHASVTQGQLYFRSSKVAGADGKTPWTALPAGLPQPLEMFLSAVRGQPDVPLVSAREAAARVSVMEAIYRASAELEWVAPL